MRSIFQLLIVLCVALLNACSNDVPGGGGIGGTGKTDLLFGEGLVVGLIDDAGGIDGRQYDTTDALITVDGQPADDPSALKTGMSVSARVDHDELIAREIRYQPLVSGPVQSFDIDANTLSILGNQIVYSDETSFDNLTAAQISAGMVLQVSGTRTSANTISANYIGLMPQTGAQQIPFYTVGNVEQVSADLTTATISGVLLDFSVLIASSNLTTDQLASTYLTLDNLLRAQIDPATLANTDSGYSVEGVRNIELIDFEQGEAIQISGLATQITANSVTVNGVKITVDAETLGYTLLGTELESFELVENENVTVTGITLGNSGSNVEDSIYAIAVILRDRF